MLWIYERSDQTLRIETRYDNDSHEYLLIIRPLDGTEQVERFSDGPSFRRRLENLERQLESEHWQSRGMRMLHDGWKLG